jgi:hypothetical protein
VRLGNTRWTERAKVFCRRVKVWSVRLLKRGVRGLEGVGDLSFAERAACLMSAEIDGA